ncbi:Scd6-like Sm domain-containing protein [Chlamydoabsidia padenii]|nr:Scd6-like Sm domain-containing protein [Chlamydoabsidia padenii]
MPTPLTKQQQLVSQFLDENMAGTPPLRGMGKGLRPMLPMSPKKSHPSVLRILSSLFPSFCFTFNRITMSGQDYIGSKISLISLSDIRYVGILHSINTSDSTVSLENVRSFGTEGRRGNPEDEVVPSDTIFDFVVFRGSDIKDLQVFEAPVKPVVPPPPPPPPPSSSSRPQGMMDPSLRHSMEGYPPPAPPPMNPYMMPPYPPQAHQAMYWQSPMYSGQQRQQQQPPPPPSSSSSAAALGQSPMQPSVASHQQQPSMPPATTLASTTSQTSTPAFDATPQEQAPTSTKQLDQQEIDGAAVENLAKQVSELDVDSKETNEILSPPPSSSSSSPPPQQRQTNYRNGRQNNSNYRQSNYTNYGNGSRNQQNGKQRISIPQSDFDFESSNAKFSKNDLLKELFNGGTDDGKDEQYNHLQQQHQPEEEKEEVVIPPPNDQGFYNKSKSFFDDISCESKERQDQEGNIIDRRGKFQEERKLNLETFGQASVDQSRYRNFRGRGGYRGGYRGNRGGYYRGGSRNNNNNNRGNYYGQRPQQQQQQAETQQQ